MMYPKIIFPENLLKILNQKDYPIPETPIKPEYPFEENNYKTKFIFIILSLALVFVFIPIAILFICLALIWIIGNPEKKDYESKLNYYKNSFKKYEELKKDYDLFNKLQFSEYCKEKRKYLISSELKKSINPIIEADYKKGFSHDFFKNYLNQYFGDLIFEDISLVINRTQYLLNQDMFKPYITDFAYLDNVNKLKIAIEIDEPYTLETKKPIHFDDNSRNDFFKNNNWIVIRFSEFQIIQFPDLCCELLKVLIDSILIDPDQLNKLSSIVPQNPSWSFNDSNKLIELNYRNSYINKIYKPLSLEEQILYRNRSKNFGFSNAVKVPIPTKNN